MQTCDAIVVGLGGVGSATLFHLAARGLRAVGIERFTAAHDRGSSHGQTRLIRQAYFEYPAYVPMVQRAYALWGELEAARNERLFEPVGLLEIGPRDGHVLPGIKSAAKLHSLEIVELSSAEAESRFQGFRVPRDMAAIFEPTAGCLRVEACVLAHIDEARRHGAECRFDERVRSWRPDGSGVIVETDRGGYSAGSLILTAGPWAAELLGELGVPLTVLRKPVFWYAPDGPHYDAGVRCPAFFYETTEGCYYGVPQLDAGGVKLAEHTGGLVVSDPATVDRELDPRDQRRVEQFADSYLPQLGRRLIGHNVCLYTMSPDSHFIVDRHPESPRVLFAAGLSGHGFKFTCMLGEALAEMTLGREPPVRIDFLSLRRFSS